ncbi:MAG: type II secretion system protein N [Venatoribacter sp.]
MLKTLWNNRWYWLLGLLTFIFTLVLTTPLHFIWRYVAPYTQNLPVKISKVQGNVWQGKLSLYIPQLRELGELNGRWQLSFLPLLQGKARVNLELEGDDLRLGLPLELTPSQLTLSQAQGYLNLNAIKPMLQKQRGDAEGEVELSGLTAQVLLSPLQIQDLSGLLSYSGGRIALLVDGKPVAATMPRLMGQLGMEQQNARLNLVTEQQESILTGYLQPDGWTGLSIKRRFIDLLGQPWPATVEPDTVVFEVSHKVL